MQATDGKRCGMERQYSVRLALIDWHVVQDALLAHALAAQNMAGVAASVGADRLKHIGHLIQLAIDGQRDQETEEFQQGLCEGFQQGRCT